MERFEVGLTRFKNIEYRQILAVLYAVALIIDLVSVNMLSIALPTMQKELQVGFSWINWFNNLYGIALVCVIPMAAWLVARIGSKTTLIASLLMFSAGSLLCGIVHSHLNILCFRIIQGLGAGLLIPVGQSLVYQEYSLDERDKITAAIQIPASIASACGPFVGGYITDQIGWRYCLIFTCIATLIIAIVAFFVLRKNEEHRYSSFDYTGLIFIISAFLLIFFSVNNSTAGNHTLISLIAFILGIILLTIFYYQSRNKTNPIIAVELFQLKRFVRAIIIFSIYGIGFNAFLTLNIFYLQDAYHYSAHKTGIILICYVIAQTVMMYCYANLLPHIPKNKLLACGCSLFVIASLFYLLNQNAIWVPICANFIAGAGAGLIGIPMLTAAFSVIPAQKINHASVIWNSNRQLIYSLGVSICLFALSATKQLHWQHIASAYLALFSLVALLFVIDGIFGFYSKKIL